MSPLILTPAHPGNHEVKNYLMVAALLLGALFIFVLVGFMGQVRALWSTTQPERDEMGATLRRVVDLLVFVAGHTNAPGAIIDPLSVSHGSSPSVSDIASPPPAHHSPRTYYYIRQGRGVDRSFV